MTYDDKTDQFLDSASSKVKEKLGKGNITKEKLTDQKLDEVFKNTALKPRKEFYGEIRKRVQK